MTKVETITLADHDECPWNVLKLEVGDHFYLAPASGRWEPCERGFVGLDPVKGCVLPTMEILAVDTRKGVLTVEQCNV